MATRPSTLLGGAAPSRVLEGRPLVATATPRTGAHHFDHTGRCDCGARRALSEGKWWYKTAAGWGLGMPVCRAVRA